MSLNHFFRRFTIRTRMIGAIFIVMTLLVAIGSIGLIGMMHLQEHSSEFMTQTYAQSQSLAVLRNQMGSLRRFEKDVIIHNDNPVQLLKYKQQWQTVRDDATKTVAALRAQVISSDVEKVAAMGTALQAYSGAMAEVLGRIEGKAFGTIAAANEAAARAKEAIHEAEKVADELSALFQQEGTARQQEIEDTFRKTLIMFGAAVTLAGVLVVPSTFTNMQSICGPLEEARHVADRIAGGDLSQAVAQSGNDESTKLMHALLSMQQSLARMVAQLRAATDSIGTASTEIASGNQDLSLRTEQTASNLQQTASSMEQLTGTVKQSAESARQANQLASSAAQVAARGGDVVSRVVVTMDEINASSKKIADIIGVIDGIAFQTNILALNAAVEAARAGEQGRGFAVVASEVRSLAQRSAQAAKEIKSLIGVSVEKVNSGARLVADAGQTMTEIVGSVQRVSDIIGEITASSAEQSDGIGQVNIAVTQLDQMTQQNAALVEQSAAAAESLKDQSAQLTHLVSTFKLDGYAAATPRTPAPAAGQPQRVATPPRKEAPVHKRVAPPAQLAPAPRAAPVAAPKPPSNDDWASF